MEENTRATDLKSSAPLNKTGPVRLWIFAIVN